ncbi:MAG: adenosylmethionine--8-amino-7-oxononanoate transaminase [Proteobacteria bacterium]|nr:adenosylmethionine--8-amino-7-oxononanoate transaminase [Pseudomonadota bacterium]
MLENSSLLIDKDLKHIWHPCAQMKDFQTNPPFIVEKAKGSYLYTNKGKVIDAISSWWCKSLGHGHPEVIKAIEQQLHCFEHIIAADSTHEVLAAFGEKIASISNKEHVLFASDGASAVEIAMKLALHAKQLQNQSTRNQFIALKHGYHGETLATLSVSDLGRYKEPYEGYGVDCYFIEDIPYVSNKEELLWFNAEEKWTSIEAQLAPLIEKTCAIIFEPLVQGANGMQIYSADFLKRLSQFARKNNIFLIADEIMTGIGRTGKWFAMEHVGIEADLIAVSKGLTSGSLPLSCVLADNHIFELFYDDYEKNKTFFHSHTYSGNALAVAAALATLNTIEKENLVIQAEKLGQLMTSRFKEIAKISNKLTNIRNLGAIVAGDLVEHTVPRLGKELYQIALSKGALLRPIGNTLYWLPPLNTDKDTIDDLAEITLASIKALYAK